MFLPQKLGAKFITKNPGVLNHRYIMLIGSVAPLSWFRVTGGYIYWSNYLYVCRLFLFIYLWIKYKILSDTTIVIHNCLYTLVACHTWLYFMRLITSNYVSGLYDMLRANIFMNTSNLFLLCQIIIFILSLDNAWINKCYNMWYLYIYNCSHLWSY